MITLEEIISEVINYIHLNIERLAEIAITKDMCFNSSGLALDSLEMIIMFINLGKKYGVKIEPSKLYDVNTIDEFASYIKIEMEKKNG